MTYAELNPARATVLGRFGMEADFIPLHAPLFLDVDGVDTCVFIAFEDSVSVHTFWPGFKVTVFTSSQ